MTATPTAPQTFSQKYGDFVRKAGSKFGFDLASLFDDDESGEGTGSLDGFAPSFNMQTMYKGRSPGTMTYTTPKNPARVAQFSLTPEGAGATAGTVTSPGAIDTTTEEEKEPVKEKANRLLGSFIGPEGTSGEIGAMGVGRAQEYGYSTEDILNKAQQEGLKFGEQAARGLGIQTGLGGYTGALSTSGALGMEGLERARQAGLSDSAIKSLAKQQGLKFGERAGAALGMGQDDIYTPAPQAYTGAPAANYNSGGSLSSYVGSGGTSGAMGASAVGRAMAAGQSAAQIRQQAAAQGMTFGPAALAMLR